MHVISKGGNPSSLSLIRPSWVRRIKGEKNQEKTNAKVPAIDHDDLCAAWRKTLLERILALQSYCPDKHKGRILYVCVFYLVLVSIF